MCGLPNGCFYVNGWFESEYDMGLSQNPHTFGLRDIFLSKYDAQGNLLWVQSAGSSHCDVGGAVDALANGTCVITGAYGYGTKRITFGYGQPTVTTLDGIGRYDVCVAKYDGNGNVLWARAAGGPEPDCGTTVAISPDGGVYVGGIFTGPSITFAKTEAPFTLQEAQTGAGGHFLARYGTYGYFQWAKPEYCQKVIALDDNSCMVLTEGGLVRYAADGTELWRDQFESYYNANMVSLGGTSFAVAYLEGQNTTRVSRFLAETSDSVALIWSQVLPVYPYNTTMCARPDGSIILASQLMLYSISADGASVSTGHLSAEPECLYAVPDQNYCFMGINFYSNISVGDQAYPHLGSGDFLIARANTLERYQVAPSYEGTGWIDFHGASNWYWKDEQATLTAVSVFPNAYEFVGWGGDFEGLTDPTITFPVDEDKQAVARFELLEGASLPAVSGAALAVLASFLGLAIAKRSSR